MKINKPLILISNDDGFQAKGINCLVNMVKDFGDVIVCAPDSARSGFACAFSATTPLRIKMQWQEDNVQVWSCNGTPVDCVKMALARYGYRRHKPWRQRFCKHPLLWHHGSCLGRMHEIHSIGSILIMRLQRGCRFLPTYRYRAQHHPKGNKRRAA